MNILLIGGGNSTHVFSVLASKQGHNVYILTRNKNNWSETITINNYDLELINYNKLIANNINIIDNYDSIPKNIEIFILAGIPVEFYEEILIKLEPYINSTIYLGSVCAYGGFQLIVKKIFKNKYNLLKIFGFQSIPWTCGISEYGKTVNLYSGKPNIHIATDNIDISEKETLFKIINKITYENILEIDFLTITLWPNNPLFHVPVLYGIFKNWDGKSSYDKDTIPLKIYADVTKESAKLVELVDEELQLIVKKIKLMQPDNIFLDYAKPLVECLKFHYGNKIINSESIYNIFRTNSAYKENKIKYLECPNNKIIPDIKHKFFTTDTPYGLCLYKDFGEYLNIKTPIIDKLIEWNQKFLNKEYIINSSLVGKDAIELLKPSKEYL